MSKSSHTTAVPHRVALEQRWRARGHKSGVIWLTGLSASGKSTLAMALEHALTHRGWQAFTLDGDNVRGGLCADLGFSPEDRAENIRRIGEVAGILAASGTIAITAFISPFRADRDRVRALLGPLFHEVHLAADLEACERRDPKGLYRKARAGTLPDFTGISSPYEPPARPQLTIDTSRQTIEESLALLVAYVDAHLALE